jgi:hypothetical protein
MRCPSFTFRALARVAPVAFAALFCILPLAAQQYGISSDTIVLDLSADGRYILQRNGFSQSNIPTVNLSVRDYLTGAVEPVNYDENGVLVAANQGTISANGRYVAFATANNRAIYLRDRTAGSSALVSQTPAGEPQNGLIALPSIAPDGSQILFFTTATNLVPETLPAIPAAQASTYGHLLLWDRASSSHSLAARAHDGSVLNAPVYVEVGVARKRFSGDGRYIVFGTYATNAHPKAPDTSISNPNYPVLYRRDLQTGALDLVSSDASGDLAIAAYSYPCISDDGSMVSFIGFALGVFGRTLIPGYPPAFSFTGDVYRKNLTTGEVMRISQTTDGAVPSGSIQGTSGNVSAPLAMSGDGRRIAFQANVKNFVQGDDRTVWSIFLAEVDAGGAVSIRRISAPEGGAATLYEGANVHIAAARDLISFETKNRAQFGLPAGDGPIFYGDLPGGDGGIPGSFFEAGAQFGDAGRVRSPSLGWLHFHDDSGWAYSFVLGRHVRFQVDGPPMGDPAGYWLFISDGPGGFWAYTAATLWAGDPAGLAGDGFLYIPAGIAGAPGWFRYNSATGLFEPI